MNQPPVVTTIDGRGLEPPEPFVLTMQALQAMDPAQALRLLLPREPFPLYQALERSGHSHQTRQTSDGTFEILIWRGDR